MTELHEVPPPRVVSIDTLLADYVEVIEPGVFARLLLDLNERDNQIANFLREAAAIHGAMPQLTAEVICQIGVGDQPDETSRLFIHTQYHATMADLIRRLNDQ